MIPYLCELLAASLRNRPKCEKMKVVSSTFMDATVSPCPKFFSEEMVSLVSSSYEGTFHIGDKEAASTILLAPFLVATVKQLQSITSRKFLVDGEFVVY